ncbi:MAG: hypothetical protein IKZ25_01395 [Clostridia bacterium]|nr:hypothetical protein [Clostridia bacterium]
MSKKAIAIIISVFAAAAIFISVFVVVLINMLPKDTSGDDFIFNPSSEVLAPSMEDKNPLDTNTSDDNEQEITQENDLQNNNEIVLPPSVDPSAPTTILGGSNSESEGGTVFNDDPDAIPVLPRYKNLHYGKFGDPVPYTDVTVTDPDIATEFMYYHRVQNYMYEKYNNKFKIYTGFYSGDESGDQWTCQFYYKDNPKIRVIAMMAKYADGTFYCYDDVDFSFAQFDVREVYIPFIEEKYGDKIGYVAIDLDDAIGTGGYSDPEEKWDGKFKTYRMLKEKFDNEGKQLVTTVRVNFNSTFENMGNKTEVLADLYDIIKLGRKNKFPAVNYEFEYEVGDIGKTVIEIDSFDVDEVRSSKDLEQYIFIE